MPVVGQLWPSDDDDDDDDGDDDNDDDGDDDDDDDDETGSSMDWWAGQGFIRGRADSRRRSPVIYISHETICG